MDHEKWMKLALLEAQKAYDIGEVPVGAVIISKNGELLAQAHNLKESANDPCAHAEVLAIQKACKKIKSWRLLDCTLYVSLEPCMMCSGAIIHSRLSKVFYATKDPKTGFVKSLFEGLSQEKLNHSVLSQEGPLSEDSSKLLKSFFKERRNKSND